jgi:hypothetical protein
MTQVLPSTTAKKALFFKRFRKITTAQGRNRVNWTLRKLNRRRERYAAIAWARYFICGR